MRTAVHDDVITIGTVAPNSSPQGVGTLWFDTSTTPGSLKVCTSTSPWTWQLANAASAGASLPAGVIVMWGGLVVNIPSGWVLCDGLNGTPDLRSKFIKGASADPGATGGAASASYTPAGSVAVSAGPSATTTFKAASSGTNTTVASSTHTHAAGSFSGTPASIPTEPAYYELCFIQKQ